MAAPVVRGQHRPRPHLDDQRFIASRGQQQVVFTPSGPRAMAVPDPLYWRPGTCREFGCEAHERGFKVTVNLDPLQQPGDLRLMQMRDNYIRRDSGREFVAQFDGSTETFLFPAGQECFVQHKLPIMRDPKFVIRPNRSADWRPVDYDEFFDRFNETSEGLNRRIEDG